MNIEYFELPVPHIIVRNVFDDYHLSRVWNELTFLTHPKKLLPPAATYSAKNNGKLGKNNHGIFLENTFVNPELSDIVIATRKVFTKEFFEEIISKHMIFEYLKYINNESFLVSYYENNDSYLPHRDNAIYTILFNFYKEPKAFTGGDLTLGEDGYTIPLENNRMILFPSWALHGVSPVKFTQPMEKFSGMGRYTISNFFYINNIKGQLEP
jgi:hypothetical protein